MYTGVLLQDMGINRVVLFRPASNSHYRWCQSASADEQMSHQLRTVVALGGSQCSQVGNSGFERWKSCSAWLRQSCTWMAEGCWWEESITRLLTAHLGGRPWYVLTANKSNKLSVMFQKALWDDSSSAQHGRKPSGEEYMVFPQGRLCISSSGLWIYMRPTILGTGRLCPHETAPFFFSL